MSSACSTATDDSAWLRCKYSLISVSSFLPLPRRAAAVGAVPRTRNRPPGPTPVRWLRKRPRTRPDRCIIVGCIRCDHVRSKAADLRAQQQAMRQMSRSRHNATATSTSAILRQAMRTVSLQSPSAPLASFT
eukprot:scaffold2664_cov117-Isochrysis_galbana.AAC.3